MLKLDIIATNCATVLVNVYSTCAVITGRLFRPSGVVRRGQSACTCHRHAHGWGKQTVHCSWQRAIIVRQQLLQRREQQWRGLGETWAASIAGYVYTDWTNYLLWRSSTECARTVETAPVFQVTTGVWQGYGTCTKTWKLPNMTQIFRNEPCVRVIAR